MSKDELKDYLNTHKVFSDLVPEHIEVLANHVDEKVFAAGEVLFRQDDSAEKFYILIDGSVEVGVPSIMGPALVVQTLGQNDILGWSWLIPPYKWTFEAKADHESKLLIFDGKSLLQYCEQNTDFGYALMKRFAGLMSERLHSARLKMMDSWSPAGWA